MMWNRLISVVEEQARTLVRTGSERRRGRRATFPPASYDAGTWSHKR